MKFLVITAIKSFEKNIKQILKKSMVHSFSYTEVSGHRDASNEQLEDNWFASTVHEIESVLFYVFLSESQSAKVFEEVATFNEGQQTHSKIHVAMMNIEKMNEL